MIAVEVSGGGGAWIATDRDRAWAVECVVPGTKEDLYAIGSIVWNDEVDVAIAVEVIRQ
jgi:hypothetical protein